MTNNDYYELNKKKSIIRYTTIKPVLEQLTNIPYAIIKGEPLSKLCYGEYSRRRTSDIDILVRRQDIALLENELSKCGFFTNMVSREERILALSNSHQVTPWHKKVGDCTVTVDINFDVFWGEYKGKRFDMGDFLTDTKEITIYNCKVKILQQEKAFIQLLLHHYKELNSLYHLACDNSFINPNLFKDVYFFWYNNKEYLSWEKIFFIGNEYNINQYFYYVLYFTNCIFKDVDFSLLVDKFKTLQGVELLDCYGLSDDERKYWKVDFDIRLHSKNIYELIKDELTEEDYNKLNRSKKIFE